jgi:spore coat polysaccharide biosynthesis protein SpsF
MLLPFHEGNGILYCLANRIKSEFVDVPIVIATTESEFDDSIAVVAKELNINCFRGSEANVLKRFVDCAENYSLDKIIRICADNPFLDIDALRELYFYFQKSDADYVSFALSSGKPVIKTHYGFWAEGVSLDALKKVCVKTKDALYLEHVTNYIYSHPKIFSISFLNVPDYIEKINIRMTIDTIEDFNLSKEIYSEYITRGGWHLQQLINHVRKNAEYLKVMQNQIDKNEK